MGNTAIRYHKILAEPSLGHHRGQIAVRGGDDPHVDVDRLLAADAFHPAVLQDAQHADLGRQRQLADLVEKQRAAVGPLEPAAAGLDRPGKCATLVAEQLRIDQFRRNRPAIDAIERAR